MQIFKFSKLISFLSIIIFLIPNLTNANCSSPPSGSFSNAWWSQYKSWCRGCGGTICETYNDCGGQCTPGPNWGGRSSGGGTGGYSAGTSSDPSTALMQGMMQGMMQGFMQGTAPSAPPPPPRIRTLEEIEADRLAAIRAAEQQAAAEQEMKRRIAEKNARLDQEAMNGIALLEESFEDKKPILLSSGGTPGAAPGHRIVNCVETKQKRDRLKLGLPNLEDGLRKTELQLSSARQSEKEALDERNKVVKDAVISEAKSIAKDALKTSEQIKKVLEKARLSGKITVEQAAEFKDTLVGLDESASAVKKLKSSTMAGYDYGKNVQLPSQTLSEKISAANKLFVESGIAEEVGEKLSETVGGPMGALAFRAAKTSIDLSYTIGKGIISQTEIINAEKNISVMREQINRVKSDVMELEKDLCEFCKEACS